MRREKLQERLVRNDLQSFLLLAGNALLLLISASLVWDISGALIMACATVVLAIAGPRLPIGLILKGQRARPLPYSAQPWLHQLTRELAVRANLDSVPALYVTGGRQMNAFAVGNRERSAIVVSEKLLGLLDGDELESILAHEVAHIRNNDLGLMWGANLLGMVLRGISMFCQLVLLILLPVYMLGEIEINFGALFFITIAPVLSAFLQLALSRQREYRADLGAVQLTGQTFGLVSALRKLESWNRPLWYRFFPITAPGPHNLLLTHPPTRERIARLLEISDRGDLYRNRNLTWPGPFSWQFR